jgi:hypothetical protein
MSTPSSIVPEWYLIKDVMLKSNLMKNKFHYMLEIPKALNTH